METKARVVLYSRPNCHLCEEMKAELSRAGCDDLYELEVIDIETEPALVARYQYDIPVLSINGVEAFRHRLRADEFKARLKSIGHTD